MHVLKTFFLLLLFLLSSKSISQSKYLTVDYTFQKVPFGLEKITTKVKPLVALALSGGGSRGLAQIGVLKAFKEANIPIDIIVGTSMGSVIGGLFAAGYSIAEIESIAIHTEWDNLIALDRETNRQELFVDQKITEDKAIFTLRLKEFKPVIPTALNDGQKLSNYLNLLAFQAPLHVKHSFDDLKIKFRAVCTDLVTGEPYIIGSGSLSQAMRASSSVSFLLSPIKLDSMILVDGGLVANIPAGLAAELGGDIVIAVNTTSDLRSREELDFPWIVADQVVSIPMKHLNQQQLTWADIEIKPDLQNKFAGEFKDVEELIQIGYDAAAQQINAIKSKIDSVLQNRLTTDRFEINNYTIEYIPDELEDSLKETLTSGKAISSFELQTSIYKLIETGNYRDVKIQITEGQNSTELNFLIEENPQVKDVEISGVTLLENSSMESIFSLLLNKPFNVNSLSKALTDLLRLYREKGYSLAEVDSVSFDSLSGRFSILIDEGIISEILIEGNSKTNSTIIRRELPVKAGDYFFYKSIEQGLINLRSTNIFDNIIFTVIKENGRNILKIIVNEKISSLIRFGFRVDNEKKAQGSIDIRDENLFGTGTELGLLLFGGASNRAYVLEHKSNRIFDTYLTYKINMFYQFEDVFKFVDVQTTSDRRFSRAEAGYYRQIFYGFSVSVGTQVRRFGNLIFSGKYQFDQIKNKTGNPVEAYKLKIVSLKTSTTVDTQDKYPYPQKGFYFNGEYETAQTILGGDIGYTNFNFEYKNYFTIWNDHTFSPRIKMGFADKTLPLSRQYSIGGQNNFFGMRENEYRGRQLFITSLEYRYRLPVNIFFETYLKFRYDLGSIWDEQEKIRFKDLKQGIGATISFNTPVGPADFSVGRSYIFKKNLPGNPVSSGEINFYFSIGYFY